MADPALPEQALAAAPAGSARPSAPWRSDQPGSAWRERWAIEQNAQLVHAVQSAPGQLALLAAFTAVAALAGLSLPYVMVAAAFAYFPTYRPAIALAAAMIAAVRSSDALLILLAPVLTQEALSGSLTKVAVLGVMAAYWACAAAALLAARRHPSWWLARKPVTGQLVLILALLVLAASPLLQGWPRLALWAWLSMAGAYLWALAYGLQDQRSRSAGALGLQLGILHPFWRSSTLSLAPTPLGKGAAFLRKHQAKNAAELAVTQLKGLKLLVWAVLLASLDKLMAALFEQGLHVPKLAQVFDGFVQDQREPVLVCWASLLTAALAKGLGLAVWGHKAIAVARLAGFRLPRNTWRPLEARTLADFWNRYYYYFKELLVEFFFFPTFLRTFRKHPRLRVFFATFMAAGVGNAVYHALRDVHLVAELGWQQAGANYVSYLFYCAVLATAIGISQARITAGRQLADGLLARLWSLACVWGFFVALQVFGEESRHFPFTDRVAFFVRLFGVS